MKAIRFDGTLSLDRNAPVPRLDGEARVRVRCAGICNTDLEITRGYADFRGILGHEFVGVVEDCRDRYMVGKRVVGEINAGCGACPDCQAGDPRHCPNRTVLGIKGRDGAFAEYLTLPTRNLLEVPDWITDHEAVFVEPLAAAYHVLEQAQLSRQSEVAVVGDGKLAQLTVLALSQTTRRITMLGKHENKLQLARSAGAATLNLGQNSALQEQLRQVLEERSGLKFDVVVEASGSAAGLALATAIVRPRGTIILKSTTHGATTMEMWPVVVDEITIVGSRCGRFRPALDLLASQSVDVKPFLSAVVPIEEFERAFQTAAEPDSMKVLLSMTGS